MKANSFAFDTTRRDPFLTIEESDVDHGESEGIWPKRVTISRGAGIPILKITGRLRPLRVREDHRRPADKGRELAHTTIVTTLNTMVENNDVKRTKDQNASTSDACVRENDVSRRTLSEFATRVFVVSAVSLLLNLIDSEQVERDEVAD